MSVSIRLHAAQKSSFLKRFVPAFLLVVWALPACAPRFPAKPLPPSVSLTDQERARKLEKRSKNWKIYEADLRVRTETPKGAYRFQTIVLADLPHRLRLEATSVMGQIIGVLVVNPEQSALWIASENVLYTAQDPARLIEHLFGFYIPPQVLGYHLAGTVPPDQIRTDWKIHFDEFQWTGYTQTFDDTWSFTWKFLPRTSALRAVGISEDRRDYRIFYEPAVPMDPEATPEKIVFSMSRSQDRMEVTVRQLQKTSDLEASLFVPPYPSGVRQVRLRDSR